MPTATRELSIVVLGTGGVGKSALSMQYVQSIFPERYEPTIEDSYRKVLEVPTTWLDPTTQAGGGKSSVVVEVMDTAGTDQFAAMRDLYMRNGDAFLLVYAIDSMNSFEALGLLHEQLLKVRGAPAGSVPVLLVGNKCDLESQRQVSKEQCMALAGQWKLLTPIETSARKNHNVDDAFMLAVEAALKNKNPMASGQAHSSRGSTSKKKNCILM